MPLSNPLQCLKFPPFIIYVFLEHLLGARRLKILTLVMADLLFWAKLGFLLSSKVNVPLRVIC